MRFIYILIFVIILMLLLKSNSLESFKVINLKKTGFHRCDSYPIGEITTEVSNMRGLIESTLNTFV